MCNEETYLLERYNKLSILPESTIYIAPSPYDLMLDMSIFQRLTNIRRGLKVVSTEERNKISHHLVCKIELVKTLRGKQHENI